jgi:hypothetical protein
MSDPGKDCARTWGGRLMTDKLAALIRNIRERHSCFAGTNPAWQNTCNDCLIAWPCDAIRAVEVVEDLVNALHGAVDYIDQSHDIADFEPWVIQCREALTRAEEKLSR